MQLHLINSQWIHCKAVYNSYKVQHQQHVGRLQNPTQTQHARHTHLSIPYSSLNAQLRALNIVPEALAPFSLSTRQ